MHLLHNSIAYVELTPRLEESVGFHLLFELRRYEVDRYPYEAKGRSDCHERLIGSSEGSVEVEKHQDHKSIVNNEQEIKV